MMQAHSRFPQSCSNEKQDRADEQTDRHHDQWKTERQFLVDQERQQSQNRQLQQDSHRLTHAALGSVVHVRFAARPRRKVFEHFVVDLGVNRFDRAVTEGKQDHVAGMDR